MDLVLVGLPGSGKSVVGRRIAARHRAAFLDLDELIERAAGSTIPEIFAAEGEEGFRARERAAVAALGAPDRRAGLARVIATGGGTVVDPQNRWRLYRGRLPVWLDGRPEVLAQRLRRSVTVRPLVAGRDPVGLVRRLATDRRRFYAAARRVAGVAELRSVVDGVDRLVEEHTGRGAGRGTGRVPEREVRLLQAETSVGTIVLGEGIAVGGLISALSALAARRAILVSEPGAWEAAGRAIAAELAQTGGTVESVLLPQGEAAKRLAVIETAASELARLRVERGEPVVVIGGGALGDAAGFLAATFLRGIPVIHVPTTLVAQIDSSIGGKTAVDLAEGTNLVGAFHQPATVVIDIAFLRTLPVRERRAALAEAVKMAVLGDERLFGLLEADGDAIASGSEAAFDSGAVAELVERAAWAKVEIVSLDEREAGDRIRLNLGHSLGHAFEAAAGYAGLLHGEAVAYGLRAACRIGQALGITPPERTSRVEALLDRLGLAVTPLDLGLEAVLAMLATDKKHAGGQLRWVLPTGDGTVVRPGVPDDLVERVARELLAPATAPAVSRGS
jgi:3-dehydroquinate synthetase/shikimate kinase